MNIKKYLILSFLCMPLLVLAQKDSTLKLPHSKSFMIEMNFDPFGGDEIFSFDNLQSKIWVSNKSAIRLGIQFDHAKNDAESDVLNNNSIAYTEKFFLFGIKPGMEFRIFENSKVSPYWGFELMFTKKSSSSEYTNNQRETTKIEGAWLSYEPIMYYNGNGYYYYNAPDYTIERAFKSYGANLMLGVDYFFMRNMYLGLELGLGYKVTEYDSIDVKSPDYTMSTIPSSKSTDLGFYYNNSFRIGIWF